MVLLQRRAAALFLFAFIFLMPASHAHSREKTDIKTLVIVSHPYPERSVLTKGLQEAAESLEGVTVRNLETLYGYDTRRINGDAERKMMREHRRVVFIFPTHWFNITPMMKAWLNETWGSVGPGLWQGKEMFIVSTAAGEAPLTGRTAGSGYRLRMCFYR